MTFCRYVHIGVYSAYMCVVPCIAYVQVAVKGSLVMTAERCVSVRMVLPVTLSLGSAPALWAGTGPTATGVSIQRRWMYIHTVHGCSTYVRTYIRMHNDPPPDLSHLLVGRELVLIFMSWRIIGTSNIYAYIAWFLLFVIYVFLFLCSIHSL